MVQTTIAGIRPRDIAYRSLLRKFPRGVLIKHTAGTRDINNLSAGRTGGNTTRHVFQLGILSDIELSKFKDSNVSSGTAVIKIFSRGLPAGVIPYIGDQIEFCNRLYEINKIYPNSVDVNYRCEVKYIDEIVAAPVPPPVEAFFDPSFFDPAFFQTEAT